MELFNAMREPKANSTIETKSSAHCHGHLNTMVDFAQYVLRRSKYDHYRKGVKKQYVAIVHKWTPFVFCYLAGLFAPPRKQARHYSALIDASGITSKSTDGIRLTRRSKR